MPEQKEKINYLPIPTQFVKKLLQLTDVKIDKKDVFGDPCHISSNT